MSRPLGLSRVPSRRAEGRRVPFLSFRIGHRRDESLSVGVPGPTRPTVQEVGGQGVATTPSESVYDTASRVSPIVRDPSRAESLFLCLPSKEETFSSSHRLTTLDPSASP